MTEHDPAAFHKLYSPRQPRATYYRKDFGDYVLMIALSALVTGAAYGFGHGMSIAAYILCAAAVVAFTLRHGLALTVPLIVRRPQDLLYTVLYKLRNLKFAYFAAVSLLVLESMLITASPNLPHYVQAMRTMGWYLFYVHFGVITIYRTVIMVAHLARKELAREVLMQTSWKRVITGNTSMTLEIVHAYCSGLLAHIILIAPWFLVIKYAKFSVIFLPVVCVLNVLVHLKWLKVINDWFYRDHWLAHNAEMEFIYLHGSHHDAIPSGMIAVAENGFLEGFLRLTLGTPVTFYNPLTAFLAITIEVQKDMEAHQYIPGVFPRLPRRIVEVSQHSTHHYGQIEPYSFGIKVDQPDSGDLYKRLFRGLPDGLRNSAKLDEELTGFKWDNPTHRRTLTLYAKYHNWQMRDVASTPAEVTPEVPLG
ncbi:MAG TPA: hypothetical protein VGF48_03340 [Thermoanaerobaculia bacterium]|jgi:hypothetical protein